MPDLMVINGNNHLEKKGKTKHAKDITKVKKKQQKQQQ